MKLMKVADVAEMLSISLSATYKLVERGELNSYKVGAALRFSEEHIADFLARCDTGLKLKTVAARAK